ncbi:MAG: hypothetical protein JWM91_3681, partial [Rhodospirillales bacterium]|nr:hypothetical protein [Rhodospirillales bacterium]
PAARVVVMGRLPVFWDTDQPGLHRPDAFGDRAGALGSTEFGERGLRINAVRPGGVNSRTHKPDSSDDPIVPSADLPPLDVSAAT